jgi:hypothetical protein
MHVDVDFEIPHPVSAVCATFLEAVPPGLVTGLYLHGGLAFGEWVPGRSDVDFVATLALRPSADDVQALRDAHERVAAAHSRPYFSGMHVTAADLTRDPASLPDVPVVLEHTFDTAGRPQAEVAWAELALGGITMTGPSLAEIGVHTDYAALLVYTRNNLDTYWRQTAEQVAAEVPAALPGWACCWCVLGVARLHHLLVTGEMTTKSAAGRWGLTYYPERWHRVLREALRIREGGLEYADDRDARGRDTAEFTAFVVHEGTKSPG